MTAAIVTLATIPAILGLVNLAKQFGIVGRWSALLAVLLGVLIAVVEYLTGADVLVTAGGVYSAVATGVILGLSAAGLYDATAKPPAVLVGELASVDAYEPERAMPDAGHPPAELVPPAEQVTAADVARLSDWHDRQHGQS